MEDSAATANRFKIYYEANKQRILEQKREAYQKNREKKLEYMRRKYAEDPEFRARALARRKGQGAGAEPIGLRPPP